VHGRNATGNRMADCLYVYEVRLFTKVEDCEPREIEIPNAIILEHFLQFNPNWVKSVDFGAPCLTDEIQKTMDFLRTNYPKNILCRKAVIHKTEYALEYNEI
jgi:hypothetical protein